MLLLLHAWQPIEGTLEVTVRWGQQKHIVMEQRDKLTKLDTVAPLCKWKSKAQLTTTNKLKMFNYITFTRYFQHLVRTVDKTKLTNHVQLIKINTSSFLQLNWSSSVVNWFLIYWTGLERCMAFHNSSNYWKTKLCQSKEISPELQDYVDVVHVFKKHSELHSCIAEPTIWLNSRKKMLRGSAKEPACSNRDWRELRESAKKDNHLCSTLPFRYL